MAKFFNFRDRATALVDALVATVLLGGGSVISWFAVQSAHLTGRPLYQSIGIGVATLLAIVLIGALVALTAILFQKIVGRRDPKAHECADGWLHTTAVIQATSIPSFVRITKCGYGKFEFFRTDPYVEFVFFSDNRSLYDIALCDDLGGSISFLKREFSGPLRWIDTPVLRHGDAGSFTVRQILTSEDVIHLLNGSSPAASFDFRRLKIKGEGNGAFKEKVQPQDLRFFYLSLNNEKVVEKYPKLEINIHEAVFTYLIDSRPMHGDAPVLVTLFLWVANPRRSAAVIDEIRLKISVNGKQHVAFAETGNDVYPRRDIALTGVNVGLGLAHPNLNAETPLRITESTRTEGALQFKFPEIDFLQINDEELATAAYTLILVDRTAEKHVKPGYGLGKLKE